MVCPTPGIGTDAPWVDGSWHGAWRSLYDGYGTVLLRSGEPATLSQRPMAATSEEGTHAALAVTVQQYRAVDVTVRQRTVEQLRASDPNTWEVPWLLWAHSDDEHFYYLVLKPNGWELGKADPAYPGAQRFLATGSSPSFPLEDWHTARVRHTGDTIEAWGDGRLLTGSSTASGPTSAGTSASTPRTRTWSTPTWRSAERTDVAGPSAPSAPSGMPARVGARHGSRQAASAWRRP